MPVIMTDWWISAADKTKVITAGGDIYIGGKKIKQIHSFPYFGSVISQDSECKIEIRARQA